MRATENHSFYVLTALACPDALRQIVGVCFCIPLMCAGFVKSYMETYPGYFYTGDAGVIDQDGYVTVLERSLTGDG